MTVDDVLNTIHEVGIVPVLRANNSNDAFRAVEAVLAGGIPIVEITMTIPNAPALIEQVVRQYGKHALIGAGTVLTSAQAKLCLDAKSFLLLIFAGHSRAQYSLN